MTVINERKKIENLIKSQVKCVYPSLYVFKWVCVYVCWV